MWEAPTILWNAEGVAGVRGIGTLEGGLASVATAIAVDGALIDAAIDGTVATCATGRFRSIGIAECWLVVEGLLTPVCRAKLPHADATCPPLHPPALALISIPSHFSHRRDRS